MGKPIHGGNPQTDEEAKSLLLGKNPSTANHAAVCIYNIKRKQELSILDTYMATLDIWIATDKKQKAAN